MYRSVLENLDRSLAPLFDRIRSDEELFANTLVLVAGDNGPEPGAGETGGLRGHKGLLYEGGIREPLVAWGGVVAAERRGVSDGVTVISALDLFPTILRLAGVESSGDGEDATPAISGTQQFHRRKPLFWRRPPDRPKDGEGPAPDLAIREARWKFLMQFDGSRPQLYDLWADREETKNLVDDDPKRAAWMRKQLEEWKP